MKGHPKSVFKLVCFSHEKEACLFIDNFKNYDLMATHILLVL